MTELSGCEGVGERYSGVRGLGPKAQVGLGVVMGVFVLVAVVYESALVPVLLAPGTGSGSDLGWWALSVGILVACVLAAPASLALLRRGMAGLSVPSSGPRWQLMPDEWPMPTSAAAGRGEERAEHQLLEAIDRHGEITPARAALETPLTVAEADRMLGNLAKKGYLEVRAREGKLVYTF